MPVIKSVNNAIDGFVRQISTSNQGIDQKVLLKDTIEVLPGELYWTDAAGPKEDTETIQYFSIDRHLVYRPIFQDFGPVNLATIHRYCTLVVEKMKSARAKGQLLVHYCSSHPTLRANAVFMVCAYQVVVLRARASDAFEPFSELEPTLKPFCDALDPPSDFNLTVLDCLCGLDRAVELGWFDLKSFGVKTYEWLGRPTHGDMTWIIPKKMLAFPAPTSDDVAAHGFTLENYVPIFRSLGINVVVRLSEFDGYDAQRFKKYGIRHRDCPFQEANVPLAHHIDKFMDIAESEMGAMAVHCKAGLGISGTVIGLYAMKHFGFSAKGFIGWCRICRPGSILGAQQQFLVAVEKRMRDAGKSSDAKKLQVAGSQRRNSDALMPVRARLSELSFLEKETDSFGRQISGQSGTESKDEGGSSPMSNTRSSRRASESGSSPTSNTRSSRRASLQEWINILSESQGSRVRDRKRGLIRRLSTFSDDSARLGCGACFAGMWHRFVGKRSRSDDAIEGKAVAEKVSSKKQVTKADVYLRSAPAEQQQ